MQNLKSYLTAEGWTRDLEETIDRINSSYQSIPKQRAAVFATGIGGLAVMYIGKETQNDLLVGSGIPLLFTMGLNSYAVIERMFQEIELIERFNRIYKTRTNNNVLN